MKTNSWDSADSCKGNCLPLMKVLSLTRIGLFVQKLRLAGRTQLFEDKEWESDVYPKIVLADEVRQ